MTHRDEKQKEAWASPHRFEKGTKGHGSKSEAELQGSETSNSKADRQLRGSHGENAGSLCSCAFRVPLLGCFTKGTSPMFLVGGLSMLQQTNMLMSRRCTCVPLPGFSRLQLTRTPTWSDQSLVVWIMGTHVNPCSLPCRSHPLSHDVFGQRTSERPPGSLWLHAPGVVASLAEMGQPPMP